jgi:hypothetical protein
MAQELVKAKIRLIRALHYAKYQHDVNVQFVEHHAFWAEGVAAIKLQKCDENLATINRAVTLRKQSNTEPPRGHCFPY